MGHLRMALCSILFVVASVTADAQEPKVWTFDGITHRLQRVEEFKDKWRGDALDRLRADIARKAWNGMGARMRAAAESLRQKHLDEEIAAAIRDGIADQDTRSHDIARAGVHLALERNLPVSTAATRELITAGDDLIEGDRDSRLFLLESYIQVASGEQLDFVRMLSEGKQAAPEVVQKQAAEFLRVQKETVKFSADSPKELLGALLEDIGKADSIRVYRYHLGWGASEYASEKISEYAFAFGSPESTLAFYSPTMRQILGIIVDGKDPGAEWVEFDGRAACRYASVECGFYRRMGRWYMGYTKLYRFFTLERLVFPDDLRSADVMTFDRLRDVEWEAVASRQKTPDTDERLKLLRFRAERATRESPESIIEFRGLLWSFGEDAGRPEVIDAVIALLKDDKVAIAARMACVEFALAHEMQKAREVAREIIRTTDNQFVLEHLLDAMMQMAGEEDVAFLRATVAADDCRQVLKKLGALHLATVKGQGTIDRTPMSAHLHVQKTVTDGDKNAWKELYLGPVARREQVQKAEEFEAAPGDTMMAQLLEYGFGLYKDAESLFLWPRPATGHFRLRTLGAYAAIRTQYYEAGFRSYAGRWYPTYFLYPDVRRKMSVPSFD